MLARTESFARAMRDFHGNRILHIPKPDTPAQRLMPVLLTLRPWQLALATSVFIVAADNTALISLLLERLDLHTVDGFGFFVLSGTLVVTLLSILILFAGSGRILKASIGTLLLVSAVFGYFINRLGVIIDVDMFVNVVETIRDRNSAEARELMSADFLMYLLLRGAVPAALLLCIRVVPAPFLQELRHRSLYVGAGLSIVCALLVADFRYASLFAAENRDLRYDVVPLYPLAEAVELISDSLETPAGFQELCLNPWRPGGSGRRTVGVMVVGETARADHFSLSGYGRPTNPLLERRSDLYYAEAEACGTSTAFSVPCMFFLRGRENYTPAIARTEPNVLDLLEAAGVTSIWIDNNSSCKNVCNRIRTVNLREQADGKLLADGEYDDALIPAMERAIADNPGDVLVVLHTMGSHGPAYSRRYPPAFARFEPACRNSSPVECETAEVANAYDNTIVYTDHILDRIITRLSDRAGDIDAFLLYASDHGESLGEDGLFLHGLPRAIAPAAQTRIPMLLWLSEGFRDLTPASGRTLGGPMQIGLSHDNISHTLLGLFNVRSAYYRATMDLTTSLPAPSAISSGEQRGAAAIGR